MYIASLRIEASRLRDNDDTRTGVIKVHQLLP